MQESVIEIREPGGASRAAALDSFIDELEVARASVVAPFASERLDLVADISTRILKRTAGLSSPAITHFAYWTRRAALKTMANDALARLPARCVARPRGLVFHLPPQNVETVFLYSWLISYLVGNANLTRLPTSLGPEMETLVGMFQNSLAERGDGSQVFVRYAVSDRINRRLSAVSDARLVWGGDAKVATFAPLPLRDGGKPIWFGDRRSLAMVDGARIAALDVAARRDLAGRLHNDIFVFDQMACSSPVRMFVVGDEAVHGESLSALMRDLSAEALARGTGPATGHVIRKMVVSMAMAGDGRASRVTRHSNALTTTVAGGTAPEAPVGGGFLDVIFVPDLAAIYPALEENSQTAVHFGFDDKAITAFAAGLPPFALSRIAPIGQALDFDVIWDGYDLCLELTRLLRAT